MRPNSPHETAVRYRSCFIFTTIFPSTHLNRLEKLQLDFYILFHLFNLMIFMRLMRRRNLRTHSRHEHYYVHYKGEKTRMTSINGHLHVTKHGPLKVKRKRYFAEGKKNALEIYVRTSFYRQIVKGQQRAMHCNEQLSCYLKFVFVEKVFESLHFGWLVGWVSKNRGNSKISCVTVIILRKKVSSWSFSLCVWCVVFHVLFNSIFSRFSISSVHLLLHTIDNKMKSSIDVETDWMVVGRLDFERQLKKEYYLMKPTYKPKNWIASPKNSIHWKCRQEINTL